MALATWYDLPRWHLIWTKKGTIRRSPEGSVPIQQNRGTLARRSICDDQRIQRQHALRIGDQRIDIDLADFRARPHQSADAHRGVGYRYDIDRCGAAEAVQQARALEPADFADDAFAGQIRRHQPHVVERFGPD